MKVRRIPLRKCVACQEMMPKKELIRVVRTPDDEVLVDLSGKKSGRGAYLCGKIECFRLARKIRAFDKALKHRVPPELYERLELDFVHVEPQYLAAKEGDGDEK